MSKLQNLTLWIEVNKTITHGKRFQMICQKSVGHDITQPKLSAYPWRFYGDDKTLKRRIQTFFILNIRGLNIQLKRMRLLVSVVSFLSRGKVSSPFFLLSSFALISIECNLSHPNSVDIEHFIENFKLYSNKCHKILL